MFRAQRSIEAKGACTCTLLRLLVRTPRAQIDQADGKDSGPALNVAIRLSVGIEDIEDILSDLDQALPPNSRHRRQVRRALLNRAARG
jgi:hypothetical protein